MDSFFCLMHAIKGLSLAVSNLSFRSFKERKTFLLVDNVFGQEGTTVLQKYVDVTDNDIFYVRSSYYAQFMSEVLWLKPQVGNDK